MTMQTVVFGAVLLVGVANVVIGCGRWRAGGKQNVLAGTTLAAMSVSALTVGWARYAAWGVLAAFGLEVGKRFFTDRNPPTLWIGLVFLPMLFVIALTEVILDELSLIQQAVFSAIAMLAAAALVTVAVRLIQARRARRA